ncbi:MAG: hypothetical protein ACKVK3_12855 [Acidimicrobiales bacterium]|jgi:hypothetical protein|tara:strand:- start:253 stop:414 length:162 start_codon:yes stop_codon:yes gene_type:complete
MLTRLDLALLKRVDHTGERLDGGTRRRFDQPLAIAKPFGERAAGAKVELRSGR